MYWIFTRSTDTSAIGIGTTVLYSILQPISDDTGIPLATLNAGTGYSGLVSTFLLMSIFNGVICCHEKCFFVGRHHCPS